MLETLLGIRDIIFFIFFIITCPQAHNLQSKKLSFLLKIFC
jgi:hypothetical protein